MSVSFRPSATQCLVPAFPPEIFSHPCPQTNCSAVTPLSSSTASVGTFNDLFGQLDADDRVKGKQFERICKFLSYDPVYKHELRRVWLWDEWPGRWGGDAGIDLVAEDRNGHLWAIQALGYSPATSITKHDMPLSTRIRKGPT